MILISEVNKFLLKKTDNCFNVVILTVANILQN